VQWWLRALGARVGKNVCQLGVVGGIETDLKIIESNACLNFNAKPLSHSLEYHMLTFGKCTIKEGATIGCRSIVEMDAVVPAHAIIPAMTPVHAVKVSRVSVKNLLPASDIQRSYSIACDGAMQYDDVDPKKDLEAGVTQREMIVTSESYYINS
jgi:hypothetical protein